MLLAVLAVPAVQAAPYYWADWQGTDLDPGVGFVGQGVITTGTSTVTVTYTNAQGIYFYNTGASGETDYWTGGSGSTSPYTSTQVDNRPTGTDLIALQYSGGQTLQFSEAIANPVFAFVSLNRNGYEFDQDFEILSLGGVDGNACGYFGCGGAEKVVVNTPDGPHYQLNSNDVGGTEPHGTLRFLGTFDTLTWFSRSNETWNGFTVGVQGTADEICPPGSTNPGCSGTPPTNVPEPGALALFALGLSGILASRRRRG